MDKYFQKPNLPIVVAVLASVVALITMRLAVLGAIIALIAFGAWFTWSWLEIFQGTYPIRRVLGVVVMVLLFGAAVVGIQLKLW